MHRFFVPKTWINEQEIILHEAVAHQIVHVLRLRKGEQIVILDNEGKEYHCEIVDLARDVKTRVIKIINSEGEPARMLDLYFPLSQREKVEWILQKCTEVGVRRFFPFICARSLARDTIIPLAKMERWKSIIREAAEQSRRGLIPRLESAQDIRALSGISGKYDLAGVAWENERSATLGNMLNPNDIRKIALMIGPEGGFELSEIEQITTDGWKPFTLGKRILRLETAAIVASALILSVEP
jgi:16S rRNA (uracil1498-N3)-methyltransferase